jgi:hypothetical protein
MTAKTEKPALTQVRVFKDDTPEISHLGERLEASEKAKFNTEHVVHRAIFALAEKLDALERELAKPETQAA